GIQLLKWFRSQPVETALCVHGGFHETGLAQHSQVLRHGRLRHTKLTLDLSHRLSGRDQEAQYRAAVRLRNDLEHRFHLPDILHGAYTCQGIYRRASAGRNSEAIRMGLFRHTFSTLLAENDEDVKTVPIADAPRQ